MKNTTTPTILRKTRNFFVAGNNRKRLGITKHNAIRIAVQKSGRLKNNSIAFLDNCGLQCSATDGRQIIVPCTNDSNVEILYVRQSDIPRYIQWGVVDFGIIGKNILYEDDFTVNIIKELDFGKCSLIVAVPIDSTINDIAGLEGKRIATSYPNSLRKIMRQQQINITIVEIAGSVEAAPTLGLADAICDITQTGDTMRANGLRQIETLFSSSAVLIESPLPSKQKLDFKEKYSMATSQKEGQS